MSPLLRAFSVPLCLCGFFVSAAAEAQELKLAEILIPGQPWEKVAEGFKFTEGPAVDALGNVYFTDIPNNRIHKFDIASAKASVFVENSGASNGLMFGPDGRLYACQNGNQKIVAYDSSGTPATIADGVNSNDLVVTRAGAVYFTDPKNSRVWHVDPKGNKKIVDEGIERPNGIILWPDQRTLVVADSAGKHLWAFVIADDGSLKDKQPFYTLALAPGQLASRADGMTIDSDGRVYSTSLLGLQIFDTQGRLMGVIAKPQPGSLSNVVFAGPKLDTLYATAGDKLFRRKVTIHGIRYTDAH
ncbi:MAG TPA: SMP-30/gluconolactonase/LRE family protein [Pirellulales bacterium]|jgi:sugar lactone lactonase YvrE|nr:SMP-30/gluconolactonase/LRE family protein [Pirellulales bacterium]